MTIPTGGNGVEGTQLNITVNTKDGIVQLDDLQRDMSKTADAADKTAAQISQANVRTANSFKDLKAHVSSSSQNMEDYVQKAKAVAAADAQVMAALANVKGKAEDLIASLLWQKNTFGMTTDELNRYRAALLHVHEIAGPILNDIKAMSDAQRQYGVVIQNVTDIEAARAQWEQSNLTALNAQRQRALNDQARMEESAMTSLNAQRRRALKEQADMEKSAATALAAQRKRALNEQAQQEESARTSLNAQRRRSIEDQKRLEESSRISLNAQRIRSIEENKKAAVDAAEKQAIQEIEWMRRSVKSRIDELERLREYQNRGVRQETIDSNFSSAAVRDLPNLAKYQKEYNDALSKGHGASKKFNESGKETAGVFDGIRFSSARARAEIIVLAHEMVTGRFTRIPGSMMVLAEYTNMASLATGALGIGIGALAVSMGLLVYETAHSITQTKMLNDALNRSNAVSGATASSLRELADAAGSINGEFKAAYEATSQLARGGKFSAEQLGMIIPVVTELEHYFKGSLADSIKEFESLTVTAGKTGVNNMFDVSKSVVELNGKYHFLNSAVLQQIIALESEGRQREASAMAIRLFTEEGQRAASAAASYMGFIERGWHAIKSAIERASQAMANWGKARTKFQAVNDANDEIIKFERFVQGGMTRLSKGFVDRKRLELQERLRVAKEAYDKETQMAKEASDKQRAHDVANQNMIARAFEDRTLMVGQKTELQQALERNAQQLKEIIAANPEYLKDEKNAKYEAERVAAIQRKYKEDKVKTARSTAQEVRDIEFGAESESLKLARDAADHKNRLIQNSMRAGVTDEAEGYAQMRANREKELKDVQEWYAKRQAIIDSFKPRNKREVAKKADARSKLDAEYGQFTQDIQQDIQSLDADEVNRAAKAHERLIEVMNREHATVLDNLDRQIEKQSQHNAEIGLNKEQIEQARKAQDEAFAAANEREAEALRMILNNGEMVKLLGEQNAAIYQQRLNFLDQVIAKQRQLAGLHAAGAKAEANSPDKQIKDLKRLETQWRTFGDVVGKSLEKSFGTAGKAISQVLRAIVDGQSNQLELQQRLVRAQADARGQHDEELLKEKALQDYRRDTAKNQMSQYGDMTHAAAGFFDEQSKGYKTLMVMSKIFHAAELAMTIAELVPKATAAILTQGLGDPYTAFARMAAMAALVAGLGVAIAGGGRASANPQQARREASGAGSVLGDDLAKSQSLAKSIDRLSENSSIELTYTSQMLTTLRSIRDNIGGLTKMVVTTAGLRGTNIDEKNLNLKTASGWKGLFGGKTQTLVDSGVLFNDQSVGGLIDGGFHGEVFNTINETRKLLGVTISDDNKDHYGPMDQAMKDEFQKIIKSITNAVADAGSLLGGERSEIYNKAVQVIIPNQEHSFKGMTGQQVQEQLEAIFSKIGDDIAKAGLAGLGIDSFQKVGEGMLETVVRVATGIEQAELALERLGIEAIKYTDVANKQGDVAVEIFRQSVLAIEGLNGVGQMLKTFDGDLNELADTYVSLLEIRKAMVLVGAATLDLNVAMVRGAGGLSELQSALDSYFDNFFNEDEQRAAKMQALQADFEKLNLVMPTTRKGFRDLAESLKAADPTGRKFAELIKLSEKFADVFEELVEEVMPTVEEARDALTQAYEREANAIKETKDRMESFGKSLQQLKDNALLGDKSPLTPLQRYAEARRQFEDVVKRIQAGDKDAQGEYSSAYDAFLEISKLVNASGADYQRDFAYAQKMTEEMLKWTKDQVTVADASLEALNKQVEGLIEIKEAVLSVNEAIMQLAIAMGKPEIAREANARAITSLYEQLLGRGVDAGGMDYWQDKMGKGATVGDVGNAISQSPEYKIQQLYQSLLGRTADAGGLDFWVKQMNNGVSIDQIAAAIGQSPENTGTLGSSVFTEQAAYAPNYSTMGTTAMVPLVNEIRALREDNRLLREEVAGLRTDQQQQTSDLIVNNNVTAAGSAEVIASSLSEIAQTIYQTTESKVSVA